MHKVDQILKLLDTKAEVIISFLPQAGQLKTLQESIITNVYSPIRIYNVITTKEIAETLQVIRVPQLRYYRNGSEIGNYIGVLEQSELLAWIKKYSKK